MISLTILCTVFIDAEASEKGDKWVIGDKVGAVFSTDVYGPADGVLWSASANTRQVSGSNSGVFQVISANPNFFTIGHTYSIEFSYSCASRVLSKKGTTSVAPLCQVSNVFLSGKIMAPDGTTCGELSYVTTPKRMSVTYTPNSVTGTSNNFTFVLNQTSKLTVGGTIYYGTNHAFCTEVSINFYGFTVTDITDSGMSKTEEYLNNIDQETKKQTEIMQEQQETTKNIFQLIGDFFKGFFDNLIGIFLPKPDYFVNYVERIRALFEQKMSLFYYPVESFIKIMAAISGADGGEAVLSMPDVKWQDTVIIPATEVRLSEYVDMFPGMQTALHLVTNVIFIGAFVLYLQNKIKEWLQRC